MGKMVNWNNKEIRTEDVINQLKEDNFKAGCKILLCMFGGLFIIPLLFLPKWIVKYYITKKYLNMVY